MFIMVEGGGVNIQNHGRETFFMNGGNYSKATHLIRVSKTWMKQ